MRVQPTRHRRYSIPPEEDPATGDLVMALARRVRRAYADSLAEWQVTPWQSRALRVLSSRPDGMRPSALAGELRIAPRSATEVVDALEERGWVRRAADPTDRRATTVSLTSDGLALVARIDAVRRTASERVLGVLTEEQRRTLHGILRLVVGEDQ